jgi:hypothetical protein
MSRKENQLVKTFRYYFCCCFQRKKPTVLLDDFEENVYYKAPERLNANEIKKVDLIL